ncbi:multifunctional CCA addition/repair protein [Noviherbaspirillum soli]|uniref:multifunctional CCA addition/repair protein n=1 Tax=Noviherbaspirillum soli TaxID=1064518 RepID=UPI00188B02FE|nr:multifunctional CCA addition/repair protein [Noviherbaspirillum soli]
MKTFVVGGAVRDRLLGLPVQDRDHVVIGATPEQMLAQGFRPVGKDFPVFLHPRTSEEYALARTERKTAPGYKGFLFHAAPDVTLEEDLVRRDLTINAIAETEDGALIDPFGGQRDLAARVFRHVSDAFAEDPVRILRLARFAARFADFTVAPETGALMQSMVAAGEVDALVPERVWQELSRGLMEQTPSRMFEVLRQCGALARLLPELDSLWRVPQAQGSVGMHAMRALDMAARLARPLPVRFAVLMLDLGRGALTPSDDVHGHTVAARSVALADGVCRRLKIPNDCRDLALMSARERDAVAHALELAPDAIVRLLERCDAFRKPQRFIDMLQVVECGRRAGTGSDDQPFPGKARLQAALHAAREVDAGAIAASEKERHPDQPAHIPAAIHAARIAAVAICLNETMR